MKANYIQYNDSENCGARFSQVVRDLIESEVIKSICDLGGGANPIISEDYISSRGLDYSLIDISQTELDKAPGFYNKQCLDILSADQMPIDRWDLVFSQALAEHVKDGKAFHENIFKSLKPGGYCVHLFPSLFAVPFLINKFLPEELSSKILDRFIPRDRYQHDKFPAYYRWCRGPTKSMCNRFEKIGFEIVSYQGLFGHRYYQFFTPLHKAQKIYTKFLLRFPNPYLVSYVLLTLKKPAQ